jgi:hypothetical protein
MGKEFFLVVRKSQIRKFMGSFRNRKSANFSGAPARKSQIRKFWLIRKSQIRKFPQKYCTYLSQKVLKVVFYLEKIELGHYMFGCIRKEKKYVFANLRKF